MERGGTLGLGNRASMNRDRLFHHRPNITIFFTLLGAGVSFAWLGVEDPSQWRAGAVLYILGSEYRGFYFTVSFEHVPVIPVVSYQVGTVDIRLLVWLLIP